MSKQLITYLSIGAGIGVLSYIVTRLTKSEGSSHLTLELTRKVAQEIKYQVLVVCITFVQQYDKQLKKAITPQEMKIVNDKLKEAMTKIYNQKEGIIIGKYEISRELYGESLKHFKDDPEVARIKEDILKMMGDAVQGKIPDLTVPNEALTHFSLEEAVTAYRELSELIVIQVWKKIMELTQNDPTFNVKDDEHFRRVLRQLSVYDIKVTFLLSKGFRDEWGCPNETFFKVLENHKLKNNDFKAKITAIQKSYEEIIEVVSHNPQSLTEQGIIAFYKEKISKQ